MTMTKPHGTPHEELSAAPAAAGHQSLCELFERSCASHAHRVAFMQMGASVSFHELLVLSGRFSTWLQNAGFKKGDRIAIMLPNVLQYPIVLFGALRAGMIVVNTNPLYTAHELQIQLQDSGAVAIVVLENFSPIVSEIIARTNLRRVIVTAVGDSLPFPKSLLINWLSRRQSKKTPAATLPIPVTVALNSILRDSEVSLKPSVHVLPDDLAFLQYTGGTTGGPKGAMLTHGNVCSNVLQCEAWLNHAFDEPRTLLTALPLYHVFALTVNCLVFLRLGWRNVLIVNARDIPRLISEIKKYPITFLSGVNTLFKALLNAPAFSKLDFRHLRLTLAGGMAVERPVAERWKELTGTELTQAWGLTETSPGVCINPPDAVFNGSVGAPIPGTEISIKDDAGVDLEVGQVGELCVRGPQVMAGYWNRATETREVMLPGGWLRTGDIGRIDEEGFAYIVDRKKDMIIVSGFNVYSSEVEAVALTHPDVLEAAAVGQPDAHSGEVVSLHVVCTPELVSAAALIEHCRKYLAAYKVPKYVYFSAALPKTNVGKISKQILRAQLGQMQTVSAS